ncbi:hypothetical protein P3L10_007762 [Capsicum annuum]
MKSFEATSSDADKPDKFLAYMVPAPNELSKDMYDENEEISYSLGSRVSLGCDDADDPTTYIVAFGETEAHYMMQENFSAIKGRIDSTQKETRNLFSVGPTETVSCHPKYL